jgi:uncharacterized protein YciI
VTKLDSYTVVFLRRPADSPSFSDEELDELQRGHLAFHDRLRREGHIVFNGPLLGQPDESLRGMAVYRTTVEDARRLAEQDPSVQARRLEVEACTWLIQPGALGDRPTSIVDID